MRFLCERDGLADGLAIVGRAVATRSAIPVLYNVLLAAEGNQLKMSATDLEIGISHRTEAEITEEGAITVPARILAEFVKTLPRGPVEAYLGADSQALILHSGRHEVRILGISAGEFPAIASPDDGIAVPFDMGELARAIDRVAFAAATDESRPALMNVLMEIASRDITLVAADGYRLSMVSWAVSQEIETPMRVLIPARALKELRRILGKTGTVTMLVAPDRKRIFFRMPETELTSELVEGNYPNYQALIPVSYTTRVVAETADLLSALRTASVFARDAAGGRVRLQVSAHGNGRGQLAIFATSSEQGDNVGELDVSIEGKPIEIAFNVRYLLDVLKVMGSEQIVIEMREATSPAVFRPTGDESFVHLIMPMITG